MAHRRILTAGQRQALFGLPNDEVLCAQHYTLSEEDLKRINRRRKAGNRLGFALQLCALRYPGRLLQLGEVIPEAMVRMIASQTGDPWREIEDYGIRENTRYEHSAALQDEYGYRPFAGTARAEMTEWLSNAAVDTANASGLAESFMATLREARVIAPGLSIFERLCSIALIEAERYVEKRISGVLRHHDIGVLNSLISVEPGSNLTPLGQFRRPRGAVGERSLRDLSSRVKRLRAFNLPELPSDIPVLRISRLARECDRMSISHLGDLNRSRRNALLVTFVHERLGTLTDEALDMADKMIGGLFKRAERRHLDALAKNKRAIGEIVRCHADLGTALIEARKTGGDPMMAIDKGIGWEVLERSAEAAERLRKPVNANLIERIDEEYPRLRRIAPILLETFNFRGPKSMTPLLNALALLNEFYVEKRRILSPEVPMAFVKPRWRKLIVAPHGFNRKVYEICVFSTLRNALRAGDIWVEGSKRYRSFDEQLLSHAAIAKADRSGPLARILSLDPDSWLNERRTRMNTLLQEAEKHAAAGTLPEAAIREGRLSVSPIRNSTPPAARDMARLLYSILPRVRITDLLEEVDGWSGLTDCFAHLRTGHPPKDRHVLYAALIADGLNLGVTRMSEACEGMTYWRIARLVDWHIREETYVMATKMLVEAQEIAPFAHLWGDGSTSSSDGQYFQAGGPARAVTETNIHYGTEPGVKFYTHISDQFAAYHTKAIAASAPEAPHVLDGLLRHEGQVPIREHHTDTGGFTDLVFALCALMGYSFSPRIRDLPDKRLYVFGNSPMTPTLSTMISRRVRESQIYNNWPEIQRLSATIHTGTMTAAHAMTALSATTRQGNLANALGEIGRIERSILMLEWMLQPALRRRTQNNLNKGEARNNLARAVFFNQLGQIRDRSYEDHQHRAAGANLIVAAIILWNTVYLGRAAETLRMAGHDVPDGIFSHVWPLGWEHINLTGDYRWSLMNPKSLDKLRPLRLDRLPIHRGERLIRSNSSARGKEKIFRALSQR